jgi:hypothetical protein
MMIGLFLDDERCPDEVKWVKYPKDIKWNIISDAQSFINFITIFGITEVISFDHDIQSYTDDGDEITGYDLVKYLCEWLTGHPNVGIPIVYFHTQNPVGKKNMECYWNNFINSLEK